MPSFAYPERMVGSAFSILQGGSDRRTINQKWLIYKNICITYAPHQPSNHSHKTRDQNTRH